MVRRRCGGMLAAAALTLVLGGCMAPPQRSRGGSPQGADAGLDDGGESLPSAEATCPAAAPPLSPVNTGRATSPLSIVIGGQPVMLNRPMDSAPGHTHEISVLQFFLSAPYLRNGQGRWIEAQFLDDAGAPRPYGLLLVDSDMSLTARLVLAAPPGTYGALAMGIGLPAPCNALNPIRNVYPLTIETGLFWGDTLGYLFFRVEGREFTDGVMTGLVHHVGFDSTYRTVVLAGAISVGASGSGPTVVFDLGRPLDGVMMAPPTMGIAEEGFADQVAAPGVFSLRP